MAQMLEGGLYQFLLRVDTRAGWEQSNTLLDRGETGYEVDPAEPQATRMKVGDGVHTWLDLPYIAGGLAELLAEAKAHTDASTAQALLDAKAYTDQALDSNASLTIRGTVDTVETLSTYSASAVSGDAYTVGDTGHLYVWEQSRGVWVDTGQWLGPQGPAGPQGEVGPQGPKGDTGLQGEVGPQGPVGPQGLKGDTGLQGATGPQGPVGAVGPQGEVGPKGDTGTAATVTVGTTTTGAEGTSAAVTAAGTDTARVLNFTVPRGATGATGLQGAKGDKGDKGDTGPQGPIGATGLKGDKGDKGDTGAAPTVNVGTTTTGAAGTSASVTAGGTATARTFSFTIPKGDTGAQGIKGDKGDTGDRGIQGIQGIQGIKGDTGPQGLQGVQGVKGDKGDTGDIGATGPQGIMAGMQESTTLPGAYEVVPGADTGWRKVTPTVGQGATNGLWTDGTGTVWYRRIDDRVLMRFENVGFLAGTPTSTYVTPSGFIPVGFRPWYSERRKYTVGNVSGGTNHEVAVFQASRLRIGSLAPGTGSSALQGSIEFITDETFPTTLPGTAA